MPAASPWPHRERTVLCQCERWGFACKGSTFVIKTDERGSLLNYKGCEGFTFECPRAEAQKRPRMAALRRTVRSLGSDSRAAGPQRLLNRATRRVLRNQNNFIFSPETRVCPLALRGGAGIRACPCGSNSCLRCESLFRSPPEQGRASLAAPPSRPRPPRLFPEQLKPGAVRRAANPVRCRLRPAIRTEGG